MYTFNSVNGSEYEAEPSCRMRDTKNKRGVWQGSRGSGLEKWNFWREMSGEIEGEQDLRQEIRDAARVAIGAMK
jgi:hypothetical protein